MKAITLAVAICIFSAAAHAQSPTCKSQVSEKKLAGAALRNFMKRCESDARKSCEAAAKEQELTGSVKASYTTQCVSDAVGQ